MTNRIRGQKLKLTGCEMTSTKIYAAMRLGCPVWYGGKRYEKILEYICWYDKMKRMQLSVVLLTDKGNYSIRVPADKISLTEGGGVHGEE